MKNMTCPVCPSTNIRVAPITETLVVARCEDCRAVITIDLAGRAKQTSRLSKADDLLAISTIH